MIDAAKLPTLVVKELISFGYTIASAESCTGGLLSKKITDVPGASTIFGLGVCTYSDLMKQKILGVDAEIIQKFTAVSRKTAMQMASKVRKLAGTDVGVATTGYAGPTGGVQQPVGLVYVCVDFFHEKSVMELDFSQDPFSKIPEEIALAEHSFSNMTQRELIRELTVICALYQVHISLGVDISHA